MSSEQPGTCDSDVETVFWRDVISQKLDQRNQSRFLFHQPDVRKNMAVYCKALVNKFNCTLSYMYVSRQTLSIEIKKLEEQCRNKVLLIS